MARRKSSRRGSKIQPAVQSMFFPATALQTVPSGGARTSFYIDLSQVASLMNRRFYRQGINWAVAGIKIATGISSGSIEVAKLPNTWVMSNAWEKSFRAWSRMNRDALSEQPSIRPKFLDFKIYADDEHHALGYAANLLPSSARPSALSIYAPGEWEPSKVVHPVAAGATEGATIESELIAVGASYPGVSAVTGFNAVSLIEGYAASRGLPDVLDPNTPLDSADVQNATPENWMGAMFNEGTEQKDDVLTDMVTENNIAPYPFENDGVHFDTMYPGGANQGPGLQLHDFNYWTNTAQTVVNLHSIKGGNFPCGLIKLNMTNTGDSDATFGLIIDLIPGDHRGYLCEPMTEM